MKATYYMGQSIGKTRKDGSPFYVVNILALDRFGCITVSPLFVSADIYDEILDMSFEPGEPVRVNVSFNGVFQSIEHDGRYMPLEFDKPVPAGSVVPAANAVNSPAVHGGKK